MDRQLDGVGAGSISVGERFGAAQFAFRLPCPGDWRTRPDVPFDCAPDIWGKQLRLRLSNVFGTKPVTFDGVYAGVHLGGGAVVRGTNRPVRFHSGQASVTVPAGESAWSDAVAIRPMPGQKWAVSFHVVGESGPMTWHAKADGVHFDGAGRGGEGRG